MGVQSGVTIPITEEHHALAEAITSFASAAKVRETVREQADGGSQAWRKHWPGLAELGVLGIAVDPARGGGGGELLDLAVAAEACAAELVPGPLLPSLLASVLLGDHPQASELAAGRARFAVADGFHLENGRISGTATVLGAEEGGMLLAGTGADWFLVDGARARITAREALDPSVPVARVSLDAVEGERLTPGGDAELRGDAELITAVLVAAECAGITGWCLRTAAEYAKTREQFGKPIGSFQAVKLLCADLLCAKETTGALAWDAALSGEALPAAAACAAGLEHAVAAAKGCIQVLGGIGYTWEHDAHLYLRRALALRQWFSRTGNQRVARLALEGRRRSARDRGAADPETRARIAEIAGLAEPEQRRALAEAGLIMPHYPRPYGLEADATTQLAIDAELDAAGIARPNLVVGAWALPTILGFGTAEQCERFIAPTLRGDLVWCQLFSEPEAGSDLAGLRTGAKRVDGGWELSGQKVWTSMAATADWAICLARTDPEAPKHKGITYFLVDMRTSGITVRPLREITGDALFNEVFLDGVFVPDDCVVGAVNGGWKLARATLANERVALSANASFDADLERVLSMAGADPDGAQPDGEVLARIGELVCSGLAVRALDARGAALRLAGRQPGAESAVAKLVGVEHRQRTADAALSLCGPEGALTDGQARELSTELLRSRALSIAGGSTQVLGVHVVERLLGLPRG